MNWLTGGGNVGVIRNSMMRYFSMKRSVNVRKINPKVPFPEAASISQSLYSIIKQHGPLTVSNTWNLAKEANITGLNSKTHMKIMLKWMRGRKMLKLFCHHVGNSKKFLHCTLPEEPQTDQSKVQPELILANEKPSINGKKTTKKDVLSP